MKSRMALLLLLSATFFASIDHKSAQATLMRRDIAEIATPNKPQTSLSQRCNLSQSPASHSRSSTTSSTAVILENYLTASAIDEVNRCNRPTAVTRFASTTAKVWIWFDISNGVTGDRARTEWYTPDNTLYFQSGWSALPGPGSWCFPDAMPLAGTAAASKTGQWTIRVYYNESFFFSLNFYLDVAKLEQQAISRFLGNGNQCAAPDPVSIFLTTDQQVWTWFSVSNALPGDTAYAEWYEPSGSLYTTYRWGPPGITWTGNGCFWSSLGIANSAVAAKPGNWQVKVFYNNAPFYTTAFSIVPPTNAGPIIIDGTDGNDHGSVSGGVNQDGWLYMQKALESLSRQVPPNVKKTVAALGAVGKAGDAINSAFNLSSLPGNGWSLVHVDGEIGVNQWLANLSTANTGILYITTFNLVDGDLGASELAAINSRAAEIARYVNGTSTQNRGGGLFAMGESNLDNNAGAWQWLRLLFPGINIVSYGGDGVDSGITLTGDGMAVLAGLSNSTMANVKPWHNSFSSISERLKVLGTSTDTSGFARQIILGGSGGDTFLSLCDLTAAATAPSIAQTTAPVTFSATSTTAGCNNSVNMTWRRSAAWTGSQSGPRDGAGRAWTDPNFDDGTWTVTGLPDGSPSDIALPNDRYYRAHFNWNGSSTARLSFVSDDGLAIYVNGSLLGSWGSGYRQPGCVNNPSICSINTNVSTQTIPANLLRTGENVIAIDLWNTQQGFYLDTTLTGGTALPVYEWDFGDNTPHASGASVQHNYATAGTFTWKLTVSLAGAVTSVKTGTITVQGNCTPPSITVQPVSPPPIASGQTTTLSVTTQGTAPLSYQWYRGNSGDTSNPVTGATGSSLTTAPLSSTTSYWVRISNICGSVNSATATIAVSVLELMALEVTQGIQDLSNSVQLIQDKRTIVRAHVKSLQGNISQVSAKLLATKIETNGTRTILGEQLAGNRGQRIRVLTSPRRISLDDDFYFELPQHWCRGTLELEFRGVSHQFVGCEVGGSHCKTNVQFLPSLSMDLQIVSIKWGRLLGFPTYLPDEAEVNDTSQQISAIFPISSLNVTRSEWTLPFNGRPEPDDFVRINNQLQTMRLLDGCVSEAPTLCRRYYLGLLANPPDPNFQLSSFVTGMAANIPADVATAYIEDTFTPSHELGHAAGRHHTNRTGKEAGPDLNYRPVNGTISEDISDKGFFGVDVFRFNNNRIYGPTTGDLMSYANPRWISPYTYQGIRDHLLSRSHASLVKSEEVSDDKEGTRMYQSGNFAPLVALGQPALIITGFISPTQNTGNIESVYNIESPASVAVPPLGHYAIRYENSQGQLLAIYSFTPKQPSEGIIEGFTLLLPWNPITTRMVLLNDGREIASRRVSANAPRVMVTSPNGGESLNGTTATLTWTASDSDGDVLKYVVQYSANGGTTWQTLVADWPLTTYELNLNAIAGTAEAQWRVFASDGVLTAQDQSDGTFTVPKHPPQVNIRYPESSRLYVGDQIIVLEGSAYDAEDGSLDGTALTWISNLNGPLGNGRSLSLKASMLAEGSHTLTLLAKDKDNQSGVASIVIQIARTQPALPPQLAAAPGILRFESNIGTRQTAPEVIAIRNSGDSALDWLANADQGWIRLGSLTGNAPSDLSIFADPTGLAIGQYSGRVTLTAPGATDSPRIIQVIFSIVSAPVASVSAANFDGTSLAAESIVAAFGTSLATSVQIASTLPLPTSLAGTTVRVKDSAGVERLAPLFFVAPSQINYQIPPGTANGTATVTVTSGDGAVSVGAVQIASVAPGLFTVNSSGQGLAAAVALRIRADGSQSYEPVAQFDPALNKIVAVPIDLGPPTDQVFLILYGTGWRSRNNLSAVTVKIGGVDAETLFAGPADGFVGLDQLNVRVPRSLAGRGEIGIALTVDGKVANTVSVNVR